MEDLILNKFQQNFDEALKELKACQASKNYKSCFNCDELLVCATRKNYVENAYKKMSKGESGDFEF